MSSSERFPVPSVEVRPLRPEDFETISKAFAKIGWGKPVELYARYFREQEAGLRRVFVAWQADRFCGYVTLIWKPDHVYREGTPVPEINDLNVLPDFRRQGIAAHLMDLAEAEAARVSDLVGLGVGLHPGYGSAQRLYVKRGYLPDGRGVHSHGRQVEEGASVTNDDDLLLYLTKVL